MIAMMITDDRSKALLLHVHFLKMRVCTRSFGTHHSGARGNATGARCISTLWVACNSKPQALAEPYAAFPQPLVFGWTVRAKRKSGSPSAPTQSCVQTG